MPREPLLVRADRPIDLLLHAPAITRRLYRARAETGDELSAIEMQVLVALSEDADQHVDQIASRLALGSSTVYYAFSALEKAGMVTVERGAGHPRRQRRPLTPAGDEEVARLVAEARRLLDEHDAKPQG